MFWIILSTSKMSNTTDSMGVAAIEAFVQETFETYARILVDWISDINFIIGLLRTGLWRA